ncbi:MAG: hypothetical protein ACI8P9_002135 [Parasphingorhabdus sp.]|jgi:hypothetical protein
MITFKAKIIVIFIVAVLAIPVGFMALNKGGSTRWLIWGETNASQGIAIKGYDVVAYHNAGKAVAGDQGIVMRYSDADWYFATTENQQLFKAEPQRYAPSYGGYCATAISAGMTFDIDPAEFYVAGERLFLFFNSDARTEFVAKIEKGVIDKADNYWRL